MKVETYDGDREREILTGMVVNGGVLGRVASRWGKGLFPSRWANVVGSWCVDFYKKHGKPPGQSLPSLFRGWAERNQRDQAMIDSIDGLLTHLSDKYELNGELNAGHLVDVAGSYFQRVRLKRLADDVLVLLEQGKVEEAERKRAEFNRIDLAGDAGEDPITDEEVMRETFQDAEADVLFRYPGDIGEFMGSAFERDGFVAFQASNKSTKSFWLMDVGWQAVKARRRVAYFIIGDMSKKQFYRRLYTRIAHHPFRSPTGKWPCMVSWPMSMEPPVERKKGAIARVAHKDKPFDCQLDFEIAKAACSNAKKRQIRSLDSHLHVYTRPSKSVTVADIASLVESLELTHWPADVIVIDYADNLASLDSRVDRRDQIHDTWQAMRALSQKLHCLVVTATQADAGVLDGELMSRSNFSEDHRKMFLPTTMFGITMKHEERDLGLARINILANREEKFNPLRVCHVASCLPLANPCVRSVHDGE